MTDTQEAADTGGYNYGTKAQLMHEQHGLIQEANDTGGYLELKHK